jgi:poly(ribitol-phosphate) beta-N-acetylglucosaminyltransferase
VVKVSVVVPVYNPGPDLGRCLDSLTGQTMPAAEYEIIAIDDGSTDESPALLDRAAGSTAQLRVYHQSNSGWPGQPRNRGLTEARGDYVFFCDADDWLAPQALERLHAFAVANRSDIVIGKMIGIGRGVPRALFRQTRPVATLADAPLMDSLTAHKLFRRAFLAEHDIRFPEGPRRLEDHVFVVRAYCAARVISVYAEQDCYFLARASNGGNISSRPPEWSSYFDNLLDAIEIVESQIEPGPLRDKTVARWLRVEMVDRLSGQRFLRRDRDDARELFDAAHRVAVEHFGPAVLSHLKASDRPVARSLLAGDFAEIEALAELTAARQAVPAPEPKPKPAGTVEAKPHRTPWWRAARRRTRGIVAAVRRRDSHRG